MTDLTDLEQRLRRIEDEQAIVRLLHAYGHALDYGDRAGWVALFAAEARYELHYRAGLVPRAIGSPEVIDERRIYRGRHALETFARAHSHVPDRYHKHVVTGWLIERDGDAARVDSYFFRLDAHDPGCGIVAAGRYRDVVQRHGRHWRFAVRIAEIEMQASR